MDVRLTIPVSEYTELVSFCDPEDPEYPLLMDGVMDTDNVEIFCDPENAERIFDYVVRTAPETLAHIRPVLFTVPAT
jgi:hypothetical protein